MHSNTHNTFLNHSIHHTFTMEELMETIILNFLKNIFNISQPTTTQLYTFLLFIITVATLIFCKNKIVIYSQDYPLFQYILDKLRSIMLFIIQLPSFVSIFNLLSWFLLVICTKNGKEQVLIILYAEWNLMLLIESRVYHLIFRKSGSTT